MNRFNALSLPSREQLRELKRREIMNCASRMFAARGFKGTSVAAIAAELGVTKTAIYHYIPSKPELLFECYRTGLNECFDALDEKQTEDGSAISKLHRALYNYVLVITRGEVQYLMFDFSAELSQVKAERLQVMRDKIDARVRELIRSCIDEGEFLPDTDPKLASFIMFGAVNLVARWYRSVGPWPREYIADTIPRQLMRAYARSPEMVERIPVPYEHAGPAPR